MDLQIFVTLKRLQNRHRFFLELVEILSGLSTLLILQTRQSRLHILIRYSPNTVVILTLVVTLVVTSGVDREMKAGRLALPDSVPGTKGMLSRRPKEAWALGLTLGSGIAVVLVSFTLAVSHLLGIPGLPFVQYAAIKAAYTALVGFLVARWAILRRIQAASRG